MRRIGRVLEPLPLGGDIFVGITQDEPAKTKPIALRRGTIVRFRVDDPNHYIADANDGSSIAAVRRRFIVGVWTDNGGFYGPRIIARDDNGFDAEILVPFDTPLGLWVFSRGLNLADDLARPLNASGPNAKFSVTRDSSQRVFRVRVTGVKPIAADELPRPQFPPPAPPEEFPLPPSEPPPSPGP